MTLSAGTVSVDDDGVATGSGMSLAIYAAVVAAPSMAAVLSNTTVDPETGVPQVSAAAKLALKRGNAEQSQAIAGAVIAYFVANTVVSGGATVSTQSTGKLPATIAVGAPIDPPDAPVAIPVTGAIT